jgi:DNA repair exonuclease SbcCD ATPase subunit
MADVKRKVLLQFDTDLQQAKQDVTKLGELYEQSTNPTAQQGALSAEQKGALESEIGTRAADLGQSPEQVKKTLEDINKLKQEARSLDQQNAELDEKNIALAEKSKKAKDDENAAIKRAGELLGLKGDFTKKDVDAARETLRTSKDLAMSDKERSTLLKQVNREYDTARGAVRRQNNALADQQKNITIINENTNKQGKLVDDIRGKYLKLTRTTDERDTVEGKVTEEIVKQRLELGKNEKAAKNIATATENNAKAHAEYTRQIKQTPDTFGGKITSAFLYYQALSAVRRVAREAVRTITELDKALTDIAVVTSMTRQQT